MMLLEDLIKSFRTLSNDKVEPYFWSDEDVAGFLNDAQVQACKRARLLREDALPAMCEVALAVGRHTYVLHPKLYEIIHLRLKPAHGGQPRPLALKSREWLDAEHPDWRDSCAAARFAVQNEASLRVVGSFETGDVLLLEAYRLPLKEMACDGDKPEIHEAGHAELVQWALHRAFSIPDADTFDPTRAKSAEDAFSAYFGPAVDSDLRRATRTDIAHHTYLYCP